MIYLSVRSQFSTQPSLLPDAVLHMCIRMLFFHFLPQQVILLWSNLSILDQFLVNFNPVSKARMARFKKLPIASFSGVQAMWQQMTLAYFQYIHHTAAFIEHGWATHANNPFLQTALLAGKPLLVQGEDDTNPSYEFAPNLLLFIYEDNQHYFPLSCRAAWMQVHRLIWEQTKRKNPSAEELLTSASTWWASRPRSSPSPSPEGEDSPSWQWVHSPQKSSDMQTATELHFVSHFLYYVLNEMVNHIFNYDAEHLCLQWLERKSSHLPPSKQKKKDAVRQKEREKELARLIPSSSSSPPPVPLPDEEDFDQMINRFLIGSTFASMMTLYKFLWAKHGGN